MKKITPGFIIMLFIYSNSFAQTKTELPPDYFNNFNYALPSTFNYEDSIQLKTQVKNIAVELNKWYDSATKNYSIADPTGEYYFLDGVITLNTYFEKYQAAIEAINKSRLSTPTPVYSAPYRLQQLAYNIAGNIHRDDQSDAFRKTYATSFTNELQKINPDFKNDIVNQMKGSYTTASVEQYWKILSRTCLQAKEAGGNINYNSAYNILTAFMNYYQRAMYQPVIEGALYTVLPSKVQQDQVKIPMRDGIKLNAYYYHDISNATKLPAIISLSPYPSGNEATRGNVYATNGYIYVYVDTRGRRESEGNFIPYESDASDFYDIIDWVSKQEWCDGKVATSGGSYLGFDQWQAIRKKYKHPALKAINPMVAVGFGVDFPRSSNAFYPYILQWATYVSGKELNQALFDDYKFWNDKNFELYKKRLPFSKLDSVAGLPNPIFQKWVSHPDFDNYWKDILPSKEDYAAIDIPVLSITGYYDADQTGALYYYNNHQKYGSEKAKNDHYLLIGPYEHGAAQWQPGPVQNGEDLEKEAQIPIYKYVIWWFDWVLKGKQKPSFLVDKITYFETGDHVWKGTKTFKALTKDSLELFLSPNIVDNKRRNDLHKLSTQKPTAAKSFITYKHDIAMAIDSAYFYTQTKPYDDSLYLTSPYNLVFESEPLQKDIVLSDKIIGRIYVTLNVPDADFDLLIQEIGPDGKDRTIAQTTTRVRYRNGGDKPQLLNKGEVALLSFNDIFLYIKKISKGSKLRVIFQSTNNPFAEKNFALGGVVSKESTTSLRIIEANIQMSNQYPSKIVLPISN